MNAHFYATQYATSLHNKARRARKNIFIRLWLKYICKINPDEYADVMTEYANTYLKNSQEDDKKSRIQWAMIHAPYEQELEMLRSITKKIKKYERKKEKLKKQLDNWGVEF